MKLESFIESYRKEARKKAALFYGPIPKDKHVHHKDGNPINNDIGNLQIVGRSEHKRLHVLLRMQTKGQKNIQ